MKVVVLHKSYGCETGCCGHVVEVDGVETGGFSFSHPYGEPHREFAERIVRESGCDPSDLDWESCIVTED